MALMMASAIKFKAVVAKIEVFSNGGKNCIHKHKITIYTHYYESNKTYLSKRKMITCNLFIKITNKLRLLWPWLKQFLDF